MIEVRNLTKKYGNNKAIDDLSFTVKKGQIYGFLGPNGAGKSTTMNIMTGYIAASEGEVLIDGHDILKEPMTARSKIGYLPELPPLYQDMTVKEYLKFAAELKKIDRSEQDETVQNAMNMLKLEDVSDRLIRNLSKGFRQRVGFAQALLGLPEILILDEPTVGLDPLQIIEIRDLIRSLGKSHTIILSSHILSEISEVCDHIMILSKGKLVASDSTENLMKQMQPFTVLHITVHTDSSTAEQVISAQENIEEYTIEPSSSEDGCVDLTLRYDSESDVKSLIAQEFTNRGCAILNIRSEMASLEKVFLDLTEDKKKSASQLLAEQEEASGLMESVDSLLKENGYHEIPAESGEAFGPGDIEAEAASDFADQLAGGIVDAEHGSEQPVSEKTTEEDEQ